MKKNKIFNTAWRGFCFVVFLISLFFSYTVIVFAQFFVYIFSKERSYFFSRAYANVLILLLTTFFRIKVSFSYEQIAHGQKNFLWIANHQSFLDIPLLLLVNKELALKENLLFCAKRSIALVPVLGFVLKMTGSLLLKRSWDKDEHDFRRFAEYDKQYHKRFSLFLFPEGTRKTPKKIKEAQLYGRLKMGESWDYVLIPKKKGFFCLRKACFDTNDGLIDITIFYASQNPMRDFILNGNLIATVDVAYVPMSLIPKNNEMENFDFLIARFRRKNDLLSRLECL